MPYEIKHQVKDREPKTAMATANIADQLMLNGEGLDKRPPHFGKDQKGVQKREEARARPEMGG